MIIGKTHVGSGLGDSLFCYLSARIRAMDIGVDFGFVGKENFKGSSFLKLDWGKESDLKYHIEYPAGKLVIDDEHKLFEINKQYYDPEFNFIEDGTVIDGCMAQDERYWEHREKEVDEWLKVEPLDMPDDLCVIGFRGGEFAVYPDLFLTKDYWEEGITKMLKINPNMRFEVHTDDPELARQFFPIISINESTANPLMMKFDEIKIIHDIGINWRSMRFAKYAIVANSSFFIFPRWLNKGITIAPRWWGRRNTKVWSLPQNFYKRFLYI